jgi:signal transduction histidine kinase
VRSHLSTRSRLTLLYTSLFAVGGGALVLITYLLVAHSLHPTTTPSIPPSIQQRIGKCVAAVQTHGDPSAMRKCGALYAIGVQAGAAAQRSTTLTHLLTYSLLSLAGVTLLAAVAGLIVAGRILRPVHRLTAAARAASEQNLSQRIALQGPRDELRELADTFDTMLERLDRAFTSQRQFIANASHELRTPLTLMRTAIDVVLAKPKPTHDELVSMTVDVRQAVDHAERLIEALLVLARNEQARALTDPLDLAAVAEDALEGRTANGITTITTLHEAPVTGDRVLLERLVTNLLDNAERYNIAGGTVAISTTVHDATSVLRVVNTGAVVPTDMVKRLFLPFTRPTTAPATTASGSVSRSSHRSRQCTAAPLMQPPCPPVDWTSASASLDATTPPCVACHLNTRVPLPSTVSVSERASAAGSQGSFDLVEVLAAVLAAACVDRAVGVARIQPVKRQPRDARVRLLGDPKRELCSVPRPDRVDQGTGRVVEPVAVGLGVPRRPRFAPIDLLGEHQDADVPVRDVPEHAGDGPVLVHGSLEGVVVQTFDQRAHALALSGVRIDVRAILSHSETLPTRRD